jgi:hypothetical protein
MKYCSWIILIFISIFSSLTFSQSYPNEWMNQYTDSNWAYGYDAENVLT